MTSDVTSDQAGHVTVIYYEMTVTANFYLIYMTN